MATMEKLSGSKVKLTITVSAEELEEATQKAYVKTRARFNIPGFRKGKAPRKMIENAYGPLAFFDDAFEIVYPDAYRGAVEETKIEPVGRPDVSIEDFGENKPLVFTAEVAVRPEVKLGKYKGIKVSAHEYNVTDEMVDAQIEREREKVARIIDVERPVQNGDVVNLDYAGSVDGVKFDGGTAAGQELVIGSGTFIPGFEEQLVSMELGGEKDVKVTFPKEYHADELAGKDAVFQVKINKIQVKELPHADDEFAKDVSEFDTIKELRESKRKELLESLKKEAEEAKINAVLKAATDDAAVEIPDVMIENQIDYMVEDIGQRLSMQGMSLTDYVKFSGTTMEALRNNFREEAALRVKTQLVLEAISKAESIEASPEEIEEAVKNYSVRFGKNAEKFIEGLSDNDQSYFADQIITDKTIKLLSESAVEGAKTTPKAKEEKTEKAEAKKPAAKKATASDKGAADPQAGPAKKADTAKKPAAKAT